MEIEKGGNLEKKAGGRATLLLQCAHPPQGRCDLIDHFPANYIIFIKNQQKTMKKQLFFRKTVNQEFA